MEDKRLERLYDYTKWHIGIYLSAASALTAAVAYLAEESKAKALAPYVSSSKLFLVAVVSMFLAGACGGVVASSCTECKMYEEMWLEKHGPFGLRIMHGRRWAALEHFFFSASVVLAGAVVISAQPVKEWLAR